MRVLVVDAEEKVASFIKRGLEEERYSVDVALDGEKGLRMATGTPYDVILMDLVLPKKDGLTVIQELRAQEISSAILSFASKNSSDDIIASLDSGSDDCLTKPFAFGELLARVNALLRRTSKVRGADITFADLRLDPIAHKVWRAGVKIDLTAKEYALVKYFMQNPGVVLTRAMIYENVWKEPSPDSFTNIVDVYVSYLRRKIDYGFDTTMIQTVRRSGYILEVG